LDAVAVAFFMKQKADNPNFLFKYFTLGNIGDVEAGDELAAEIRKGFAKCATRGDFRRLVEKQVLSSSSKDSHWNFSNLLPDQKSSSELQNIAFLAEKLL